MRYVWATGTHAGRVRERNEDAVYPNAAGASPGPVVVAVADGMGGHVAGNVASRIGIEAATAATAESDIDVGERIIAANEAILDATAEEPKLAGMGTTMTLGLFGADAHLLIGHVGDSRAYLLRDDELRALTVDHTVVNELIGLGHLSPEAAASHPQRHMLTRSLGQGPVEADIYTIALEAGDRILITSDGLTTMLADDAVAEILRDTADVESTVWALIEAANAAGGIDNTTVAVVDVSA